MNNEERWCMNFTNNEIKTYLIERLKRNADVKYIVNDKYVASDCQEDFECITFDGIKQEFYVSFLKSQTSIFVHNNEIMFIDDNEKKYYTSSDVDDCIVYEGILNNKSHEQILELILKFIQLFQGASNIQVVEVKIVADSVDSYTRKKYIINIDNPYVNNGKYEFDNIIMNVGSCLENS